jgi:hypothetical protein
MALKEDICRYREQPLHFFWRHVRTQPVSDGAPEELISRRGAYYELVHRELSRSTKQAA